MLTVEPHLTANELALAAKKHKNISTRILAVRAVFTKESPSCPAAARVFGVTPRSMTNWVNAFNEHGLEGLFDKPHSGRPRFLSPDQEAEFKERVLAGPRKDEGLSAYRGENLRRILKEEFNCEFKLSGVYLVLHRLRLSNLVPRPEHSGASEQAREEFRKNSR